MSFSVEDSVFELTVNKGNVLLPTTKFVLSITTPLRKDICKITFIFNSNDNEPSLCL